MSKPRIQILFVIDYFHRTGGTEKHLAQLVAGLQEEGFRCSILAFDLGQNTLLDDLRARNVPVISLPVGREYVPYALVQAWRLSRIIRQNRYDIVQTMHQKADTYGALVAKLSGVKYLVSSKRDTGALRRPWHFFFNRTLKSLFDAYIVVADAVRVAVVSNDRLPLSRIVTIHNGVDSKHFTVPDAAQRAQARQRLGFAADDFVVGMVAGFRTEKDHRTFFAGLLKALPAIPRLKTLLVGSGPLLERFKEQAAATDLAGRAVFVGAVDSVVDYLWAMDMACLTPVSNEGFSNAVLEQMAVGLPVVVTDVGGNAEAIVDGESGRVIAARDASALADAILALHDDLSVRRAMGRAARRRVEEKFSIERMCGEHARLYRGLCDAATRDLGIPRG